MKAPEILKQAAEHMEDRAKTYDAPEGERSMSKTVEAFSTLYGLSLTEEQGWAFMVLLKLVRSSQGGYRADNYEDLTAYSSLMGEAAAPGEVPVLSHEARIDLAKRTVGGDTGELFADYVSRVEQESTPGEVDAEKVCKTYGDTTLAHEEHKKKHGVSRSRVSIDPSANAAKRRRQTETVGMSPTEIREKMAEEYDGLGDEA